MKYLMTFSYDGSKFKGYQKQPRLRTVQSEIEKALKEINKNKKVDISASGRTDTGVHAINQKAHFNMDINIIPDKLKMALNSMLDKDIYIKDVVEAADDFHARFDVKSKTYIYKINLGEFNPIEKDYVLQFGKKIDFDEISRGLKYLEGTHNFKSFTKSDPSIEDYDRTILFTNLIKESNDKIILEFTGTGFMRYMVRNLVGTLLEVGTGKIKSEEIISILNKKDRTKAGVTAPACGLYLKDVYYR